MRLMLCPVRVLALLAVSAFVALCPSGLAAEQLYRIDAHTSEQALQFDVLEDPGGDLDIAGVRQRDARFRPYSGDSFAQSRSVWWLRVRLARDAQAQRDWVLIAGIPTLLDVRLYRPDASDLDAYLAGTAVPQALRALPSWEPRFPVQLEQEPMTLYLRVHDPAELAVPMRLLSISALAQRDAERAVWMSLFLGLMLGLLVYNLFLYLSLWDPAYGWYVLSGTALLLCFLMITGWGSLYLWPGAAGFDVLARLFLPAVWGAAYWRFIARFFTLEDGYPLLNRLVTAFSSLFVVIALWSLTGERFYGTQALHLLAVIALPCVFLIGVRRWLDGFKPAVAVLLGQFALMLPIFIMALRISGIIGEAPPIDNSLLMGAAAETLLFAVALAQRIRGAEQARDVARSQLLAERQARLEQVEAHNAELERRVSDRTAELERVNHDLQEQKQKLAKEASQDNLTGLANRRALAQRFQLVSALSDRDTAQYALLLIDLDGFKDVNDTAGHDAGDSVLKALAQRLQALVRAGDTLARIGGDEFVVLMAQVTGDREARNFAARLAEAVQQPVAVGERSYSLGASIGVAISKPGTDSLSQLMRRADLAMYRAKRGQAQPRIVMADSS